MHAKYEQHRTDKCLDQNSCNRKTGKKEKEKPLIRKTEGFEPASSTALGLDDVVVVEALTFKSRPDWLIFFFVRVWRGKINLDSNVSWKQQKNCVPFVMAKICILYKL